MTGYGQIEAAKAHGGAPALLSRFTTAAKLIRALLRFSLIRFVAVGTVGLSTDAAVYSLLAHQQVFDVVSRAVSLALATLVTWQLNRIFTFGASGRRQAVEGSRYALVALVAQGFNYSLFLALRSFAPDRPALSALFVSAVCATAFSFAGQRFFTFVRHSESQPAQ